MIAQNTKIYSIRDSKTKVFNLPWFKKFHGDAERFVKNICSENPKELPGYYQDVSKYPQDFDLYFLGEFDEQTGKMQLLDAPSHMMNCEQIKSMS